MVKRHFSRTRRGQEVAGDGVTVVESTKICTWKEKKLHDMGTSNTASTATRYYDGALVSELIPTETATPQQGMEKREAHFP